MIAPAAFVEAAARAAGLEAAEIASRRRRPARWRHAGMWLAVCEGWSTTSVAEAFGGRDHTTVVYATRRAKAGELEPEIAAVRVELTGQGVLI